MADLAAANEDRWQKAKIKSTKFGPVAKRLVAAKDRYQAIEAATGVPWFTVAVIHERESSQRWDRSIAQGDPWNAKSVHVPKGRGPFKSWEEAAIDALTNCAPYAAKWTDWSAGGTLALLEHYNGLGYANRNLPSPYIWAGTNQYIKGKYVRDGVYDPNAVDQQLGCAGLILAMSKLDDSVSFFANPVSLVSDDPASDSHAVAPVGIAPPDSEIIGAVPDKAAPAEGFVAGTVKLVKSKIAWATSALGGVSLASVGGFLTDWRTVAAIGVIGLVAFIIYERSQKP